MPLPACALVTPDVWGWLLWGRNGSSLRVISGPSGNSICLLAPFLVKPVRNMGWHGAVL